jgi:dihydrodipicolinate synthase/N-acetylneuraminate lyase
MGFNYDPANYEGLYIPTVTPFLPDGELDLKSLERVCRYQAAIPGVAALVSAARIGEGTVLTPDEKLKVHDVMGKIAHEHRKVHTATIAPQSTKEAIDTIRKLEKMPVDAVMIFPPLLFAWGKVDPDLKVKFYEDIVEATEMPITLFQIPVQSYWYDADTVVRIARLKHIVSFKEASFNIDLYTDICRKLKADNAQMRMLTGNDRFVGKSYELGAVGALIGVANVAPDQWAELDRVGRAGDFKRALEMQEELKPISDLIFDEPIVEAVARIKTVLKNERLIAHDTVRAPQQGISEAEKTELLKRYAALRSRTGSASASAKA